MSKPKPRVCSLCLTPRPGYNARLKYPPPCPNCRSTAPPVKPKPTTPTTQTPPGEPLVPEIVQEDTRVDLKADFTDKELSFLRIYLVGGITLEKGMIQVGYEDMPRWKMEYLANRILAKHVEQAGDIKKLARSCGLSEVQVILKIKQLMENPSPTIQARGTELAAKILELTKESIDLQQGFQIIITAPDGKPISPGQAKTGPAALPAPGPRVRMIK